ncbi:MAG: hypothetical protein H6747_04590 [Deltaproteobacteria bacterium]|nr:hypothetical protein [Deltaproteobacteria bacterium]
MARGGCALAHDHLAARGAHPLAVAFPSGPWLGLLGLGGMCLLLRRLALPSKRVDAGLPAVGYVLLRLAVGSQRWSAPPTSDRIVAGASLLGLLVFGVASLKGSE